MCCRLTRVDVQYESVVDLVYYLMCRHPKRNANAMAGAEQNVAEPASENMAAFGQNHREIHFFGPAGDEPSAVKVFYYDRQCCVLNFRIRLDFDLKSEVSARSMARNRSTCAVDQTQANEPRSAI